MTALIMSTILFFSILIGFVSFTNSIIESALEKKGKKDAKPTKLIIFLETLRTGLIAEVIVDLLFVLFGIVMGIVLLIPTSIRYSPDSISGGLFYYVTMFYVLVGSFLALHIFAKLFMMQKMSQKRGLKIGFWKNTLGSIASFIFALIIFCILFPEVGVAVVSLLWNILTTVVHGLFAPKPRIESEMYDYELYGIYD